MRKKYHTDFVSILLTGTIALLANYSFAQNSDGPVQIGFLMRHKDDVTILKVAEEAIGRANESGGQKGRPFELVARSCEGPWGLTSKQAVDLIHEEGVSILVTALDGRNAHLAEQVAAKSHVVMLSTLSSDPTLSRAYIPWYFRIIPNDRQQAAILVEEIYQIQQQQKVAVVQLDDYDGKMSAEAFVDEAERQNLTAPMVIRTKSKSELINSIIQHQFESLIFAGSAEFDFEAESVAGDKNLYAFLNCFNFIEINQLPENIKTIHDLGSNSDERYLHLEKSKTELISQSHAYVYDGLTVAIEAIRKFGPNPEDIRKGFGSLQFEGITGIIEFDKLGNRRLH